MPRNQPEMRLHCRILDYLMIVLPHEARDTLIHVPNGENRSAITGAKLKRMGAKAGVEDLAFIFDGWNALEVKPEGSRQSPAQKERQAAVRAAGGRYQVVRSLDDVTDTLLDWGVPLRLSASSVRAMEGQRG